MKRHTRDTIIAEINKHLKGERGKVTTAIPMLIWQRMMVGDPDVWIPVFMAWCNRRGGQETPEAAPDIDPFDRGGSNGRNK